MHEVAVAMRTGNAKLPRWIHDETASPPTRREPGFAALVWWRMARGHALAYDLHS